MACGKVRFASAPEQHDRVLEVGIPGMAAVPWQEIAVPPPGGVHLRRMRAQWRALSGLVTPGEPATLVLLSAGPETLFVARLLVLRHRSLRLFAVMHGNLATAIGWRSRDPRRRLIDLRAGLRMAQHPRIRLVVLEEHIRTAAIGHGLGRDFVVWPHVVLEHEAAAQPREPGVRLRIAFIGTANRHKGFDDFLAVRRTALAGFDWAVVGRVADEYDAAALDGIARPAGRLSRADFLHEVRRADYAFLAFRGAYELTASGSLLDCIAQRRPVIGVVNPMLAALVRRHGPIGHLCDDLAGVRALLAEPARLGDPAAYAGFQRVLDAIAAERRPAALAGRIGGDLGC